MPRKKNAEKPKVHEELSGFEFKVNCFREVSATMTIDQINTFLNKNVDDKKINPTKGAKE